MFARTIARTAARQPCRGMAVARRGMATSSGSSKWATGKTASTVGSIVALAAGGVCLGSMIGDSNKLRLEGASKRKAYSERMILKEKGGESSKGGESKKEAKPQQGEEKKSEQAEEQEKEGKLEKTKEQKQEKEVEEAAPVDMEDLSQDASQQSAFDPETNTINWDCPCLGGMAQGPCGEEFKEAFSCFVFSEEEVKGVDCIDKFKGMQDCFRKYPEHYKEELEDEEEFERSEQEREAQEGGDKKPAQSEEDEDEGVREWRAEMSKE